MLDSKQYAMGYSRGLQEGVAYKVMGSVFEQDFAFKHEDYVRGYWDGYEEGRK